jgi:basic membrane protein A
VKLARSRILGFGILLLMLVPTLAACGTSSGTAANNCSASSYTSPAANSATASHAALVAAEAAQPRAHRASNIKVGLVTDIGGLNDKGFNALAFTGLQKGITDLGVQGSVKESKSGDDYIPNLTGFASQGYDLVIAVGFLMQTALGTVSGQFPNTHFAIIDGTATDANGNDLKRSNVEALFFKEQDAGALVGVISGMLEKQNKSPKHCGVISAVGGIKIPPVDHYIAGYQWAAKMEDPSINVLVGYSNDFADSSKCRDVANSQIAKNSDVVFQVAGGCGLGALAAAGQKGVYSIGVDTDQKDADKSVIASAEKRVDVAAFTAIQDVVNGTFAGGPKTFSLANGGVGFATGNLALPADITAEVQSVSDKIKSGALTPPDTVS